MQSKEDIKREYNEFIREKIKGYEMTAKIIGRTIRRMQCEDLISENVRVKGRVKSFESAYDNFGKKKVDDCFGIRIIGKDDEIEKIEKQVEQILIIEKVKDHRKRAETDYNAIHQMVYLNLIEVASLLNKQNEYYLSDEGLKLISKFFPIVEIQYWDEEMDKKCKRGNLSYLNYKHKDINRIIELYRTNPQALFGELPDCYVIQGKEMQLLSKEETLLEMYPEILAINAQAVTLER